MKNLLKILGAGLALFLLLAMIQERDRFYGDWFGGTNLGATEVSVEDRAQASDAVKEFLGLMTHMYGTGGDIRFADRMPVSARVLEEVRSDVEYLTRNHRVQEPRLQKLEILEARAAGGNRIELHTREFWVHRVFWVGGRGEDGPPRSFILACRYILEEEAGRWHVLDWDFDPPVRN